MQTNVVAASHRTRLGACAANGALLWLAVAGAPAQPPLPPPAPLATPALLPTQDPSPTQDQAPPRGLERWPAEDAQAQVEREARLLAAILPERLAEWHDSVASFPHVAGSPGDQRMIGLLADAFARLGLEVELHPFVAYLPQPLEARLELVSPARVELPLKEVALPGVPTSSADGLDFGWNAYSGSGTVEGELVYANYGRREDFQALAQLGVDCSGKIVVARYGGNFRGYKAKYAEEAGAAGLVIYTDPRDSGYGKGLAWPEGGWANDTCIQRGSILTLPWIGDPLTPNIEATEDAARLDPEGLALPRIPVQPIGWAAALQLLGPMRGASAPQDWQGGLPVRYRLTGGPEVRARLTVRQERRLVRTANVLATLRGRDAQLDRSGTRPLALGPNDDPRVGALGPRVYIGCHHDAWAYGASDPTCGLIAVLEAARVFAEDARLHGPPRRSITFAAWGAEEFGIIGSAEYVEARRAELTRDGLLYINLDAAANGLSFGAAATPEARALVADALASVPQPQRADAAPEGAGPPMNAASGAIVYRGSVLEAWAPSAAADRQVAAPFGELGGGSDHAPFLALTGIPGVNLSAGGAQGTAYHSIYDDLTWYRSTVGSDYASARMIARATAVVAARAAEAPLASIALTAGPEAARAHLIALAGPAPPAASETEDAAAPADADPTRTGILQVAAVFEALAARAATLDETLDARAPSFVAIEGQRRALDELVHAWPRAWLDEAGLPGRPWFRNLYVAPDETSGYASWPLPGLRKALNDGDAKQVVIELERLRRVAARLNALADRIDATLREGE
ncbi:MAG: M20/M25/M40 family metallo-hydrolase [Planctomycetota bacterium]